jgi:hypothetical protein
VAAIAYRAGDNWTVVLLDGSAATFGKRGAQIGLIVVEEKKLDWDEPLTKVYPDSKLADDTATKADRDQRSDLCLHGDASPRGRMAFRI